jgi:hypothetical protein
MKEVSVVFIIGVVLVASIIMGASAFYGGIKTPNPFVLQNRPCTFYLKYTALACNFNGTVTSGSLMVVAVLYVGGSPILIRSFPSTDWTVAASRTINVADFQGRINTMAIIYGVAKTSDDYSILAKAPGKILNMTILDIVGANVTEPFVT